MFNFFKEIYHEYKGYDIEAYREQEKERRKRQEKRTLTAIIVLFIVLFMVVSVIGANVSIRNGDVLGAIKYIAIVISEIATVVLHFLKKKTACYICGGVFIALNMLHFMF